MLISLDNRFINRKIKVNKNISTHIIDILESFNRRNKYKVSNKSIETIDQLINRNDLVDQLHFCLFILYWFFHEPSEPLVTTFFEEISLWTEKEVKISVWRYPYINFLERTWPLLAFAVEKKYTGDHKAVERLTPYLNKTQEISIGQQVLVAVKDYWHSHSDRDAIEIALALNNGEVNDIPELVPIAEQLGIEVGKLIQLYLSL